jgi:hypothetical protein
VEAMAMVHFGYRLWEWDQESHYNRAWAIALFLANQVHEAYAIEMAEKHANKKSGKGTEPGSNLHSLMSAMGI